MEMVGVDPGVQSHVLKLASSQLCSNLNGQLMVSKTLLLFPVCLPYDVSRVLLSIPCPMSAYGLVLNERL